MQRDVCIRYVFWEKSYTHDHIKVTQYLEEGEKKVFLPK